MAEDFPELLKDTNIYSRNPPNLNKINKKKYIQLPTIGKLQNTKGKKKNKKRFFLQSSQKEKPDNSQRNAN